MKKSTIFLIATVAGLWIISLVTLAIIASKGEKKINEEILITENTEKMVRNLKSFSVITFNSSNFYSFAPIVVEQCDTIKTPVIVYPTAIAKHISITAANDSLNIAIKPVDNSDVYYTLILRGLPAVRVLTPAAPINVTNFKINSLNKIVVSGLKSSSLKIIGFDNFDIASSKIRFLNVENNNSTHINFKFNSSETDTLKLKCFVKYGVTVDIAQGDSAASAINHFEFSSKNYKKNQIHFNGITINNVRYPDEYVTLTLKNNAKISNIQSYER